MPDCTTLSIVESNPLVPPEVELSILPARLGKRLWVTPTEFLRTTNAQAIASWAVQVSQSLTRSLPEPGRRGPKRKYAESSILMMAFIQVAWQMGYEMTVDYFRSHPEAAQAAGFAEGRVDRHWSILGTS